MKGKLLSRVRLLVTPWTAAYQAPPSMGFSRQEYWSGVPLPSPQDHLVCLKKPCFLTHSISAVALSLQQASLRKDLQSSKELSLQAVQSPADIFSSPMPRHHLLHTVQFLVQCLAHHKISKLCIQMGISFLFSFDFGFSSFLSYL